MAEVRIDLGANSYSIFIEHGSINRTAKFLEKMPFSKKGIIVTDNNVVEIYGERVLKSLNSAGYAIELFCVCPGEASKSLETVQRLYTQAINMGMDRKSPIIGLGGGVTGDLAGFAASTYLRGVPFIQIPTTLLAQVDSSVGGKTAVNHPLGKNLVGTFYQPEVVIIDPEVLNSLPERELLAGLAEVVKYGAFADEDFFAYLEVQAQAVLRKEPQILADIIGRCCRIKADIVEKDEREAGLRALLNFGHTIGHAVEAAGGFSKYNHGEAISIGMKGAAIISNLLHMCGGETVARLENLLRKLGLPIKAEGCASLDEIQNYLLRDKKSVGGKIKWILLEGIGKPKMTDDVPDSIVEEAVSALVE